jgi:transcriptional regulator with XRE-family HTH domain
VNTKSNEGFWQRLRRRRYRRAFLDSNIGVQIAAQLVALRISRAKSQEKLAKEIGMNQATISQMEKPDYRKYNTKTLMRFADFYDVALDVRFVSVKEHIKRILNQSPDAMAPAAFRDEEPMAARPAEQNLKPLLSAMIEFGKAQPRRSQPTPMHRDMKPNNIVRLLNQELERETPPPMLVGQE